MSKVVKTFIEDKVKNIIKHTLDEGKVVNVNDASRIKNVRFSSFPFCGVQWFLDLPGLLSKTVNKDYAFGYFTRVGTTVHEVTQEALHSIQKMFDGEDLEILWDWKCKSCKTRVSVLTSSCDVAECSTCGHTKFSREEHQVRHLNKKLNKEAVGHVDTILKVKLPPNISRLVGSTHGVIIVDYKTSSVLNTTRKGVLPYPDNVAQISKYAGVIRKRLPVIGWALVYMPRDIPFRFVIHAGYVSDEDCLDNRRDINKYIRIHTEWSAATTLEDIKELYDKRPCQSKADIPEEFKSCDHCKQCCSGDAGFVPLKNVFNRIKDKLPLSDLS
jgi:hypothetical protein